MTTADTFTARIPVIQEQVGNPDDPCGPGRPLTPDELSIARRIYNGEFDDDARWQAQSQMCRCPYCIGKAAWQITADLTCPRCSGKRTWPPSIGDPRAWCDPCEKHFEVASR